MKKNILFVLASYVLVSCSTYNIKQRLPASAENKDIENTGATQLIDDRELLEFESYFMKECIKDFEINDYNSNPYKISEAQRHAIFYYTIFGYTSINSSSNLSKCDLAATRLLDYSLSIIPGKKVTVYSGDSTRKKLKKDEVITIDRFMSTSRDSAIAEGFIRNRFWTIKLINGKDIQPYSNALHEKEVLISRNTRLRIDKIEKKDILVYPEGPGEPFKSKVEFVWATEVSD